MLLKITSAQSVYIALCLRVHTSDDSSLGIPDEADYGISFFRLRETEFNLGQSIREVCSRTIDDVVHILDATDLVRSESSSAKTYDVYAGVCQRIASTENIRRDILIDLTAASNEGVLSDP